MKVRVAVAIAALVMFGCSRQQPPRVEASTHQGQAPLASSDVPTRESLDGGYINGAQRVYLTLRKDGSYSAGLGTCTGVDGIADGTWSITDGQILFSPTNETKQIKNLLRTADIVKDGHYWALIPPDCKELVQRKGLLFETCLKNSAVLRK
jgi:hypothetical protein